MARTSTADTLEKFRFGVTWGGQADQAGATVTTQVINGAEVTLSAPLAKAGFHDVQMPSRTTNKIQYREGADPDIYSVSAGLSTMEDIVLSRGLMATANAFKEMHAWSQLVHGSGSTDSSLNYTLSNVKQPTGNNAYRKDMHIWMYNRDGSIARAWKLFNAFPVGFKPGSDLNASEDGEKSLEQLTLAYEDFLEVAVVDGQISNTGIFETVEA